MIELIVTLFGCLFLGVLTIIHPCPLASNLAAISMLSGWSQRSGFGVYAYFIFGYVLSLLGIALLINTGVLYIPGLSLFLQTILTSFLGPVFILTGMILSGIMPVNVSLKMNKLVNSTRLKTSKIFAVPFGGILALAFCPATASIYFGVLIPLSIKFDQTLLFPVIYAVGAAIPLVILSILINKGFLAVINEKWLKRITEISGYILILTGTYITIVQIFLG